MKIQLSTLLLFLFSLSIQNTQAQENTDKTAHFEGGLLSHVNLAVGFSTLGFNVEAATPITSHLKLRAGLNFFNFETRKHNIALDDADKTLYNAFGIEPRYEAKGMFKTIHSHFLVDYYPWEKGIFHITAGIYIGTSKFKARGELLDNSGKLVELINGQEWPTIEFDGRVLDINQGRLNADLKFGNTLKPYVGIGLGRAISKNRFGVKFELGLLYQGEYKLLQNNHVVATTKDVKASISDSGDYTKWLDLWPMVNFQLTYRLF